MSTNERINRFVLHEFRLRAALDPLVASWQPLKHYEPRIVARSEKPPSYYRLAVTESGINNIESDPLGAPLVGAAENGALARLGFLWTGLPLGTACRSADPSW